uniref:epithelial cell adhesion molecule-like n=1 Tax=Myxine glutinosa TaxID=7769 RepID=UPI00358DFDD0
MALRSFPFAGAMAKVLVVLSCVVFLAVRSKAEDVCLGEKCQFNKFTKCTSICEPECKPVWKSLSGETVNCDKLTPRCKLMQHEWDSLYKKSRSGAPPKGGRRDTDGLYRPECHDDGVFKTKQCNDTLSTCWCVNSAGVRRTDRIPKDEDTGCNRLVNCFQIVVDFYVNKDHDDVKDEELLKQKIKRSFAKGFKLKPEQVQEVTLSDDGQVMVTISNKTTNPTDLGTVAYYVEKQFKDEKKLVDMDEKVFDLGKREAYVWYYDDEPPTMSMERITPGIIIIVVVVVLALIACVIVSVLVYKQSMKNRKENPYLGHELNEKLTTA